MKRNKYLVFGGYVVSKFDGQWHYVSAAKVAQLYGLNPKDPNVRLADRNRPETWMGLKKEEWIVLHPLDSGKYYDIREREQNETKRGD